jgi:hypothetical protein
MTSQVLILVGVLVLLALSAAVAALLNPRSRAARRAGVLEEAEQAERMRNDPNGAENLEEVRWEAKRADNMRNFPGGIGGI